jgi:Tol biopolymer transport system component
MALSARARFGPYEITELLGAGGMGEVYRARDTELDRDVAIKVLPESFTSDAARVARFEQEAKTLAALNHPNIAHLYGLERSGGTTALAMELVEGPTLVERIDQGRVPVEEALAIATQIVAALAAAHERGIVHRDLKPANVKLTRDGTVKVLDFGIAKALDMRATSGSQPPALATPAMTETGMVLGTAAYMSPEQARGKLVDQRTDIWAFGCVLYEMLTGRAAFLGEDVTSTLARVLEVSPDLDALPSGVPRAVRRTLELCLEKDARERIADMRDVRLALKGAFAPAAPTQPLWRRALPAAAAFVLAAVLAGVYVASQRPAAAPVDESLPVSRFAITPPATAPLANMGDLDLAISRDGRRIAYWAQKPDGNLELYVRELDALEARAIPGTDHAPAASPRNLFFSADGMSIGWGTPSRSIVSVTIDGGPPVTIVDRLTASFMGGWWSTDDTLIFSSGRRLERVSATGGGVAAVLIEERQDFIAAPVLLPGGRAILFAAGAGVGVLDLDTGREQTVVDSGSNPSFLDSGHVVFVRGETLMAVPFSASKLTVTGEPVAVVQGIRRSAGSAADYAVSRNGTLVYVPAAGNTESGAAVVWVDRAGQPLGRAIAEPVTNPRDPRVSPNGERLLLVTGPDSAGDLWSYDLRGRPPIPLTLTGNNILPIWSPDGRRVAFLAFRSGGLMTLASDGTEGTPQPLRAQDWAPIAWLPSGELILWDIEGDIIATPAAPTGQARDVVASGATENDAALSRDGRWLAYVSNRTGADEIWVQAYPEGVPQRVSRNGGHEPRWSADGRELFYRQSNALMAVAVEAGTEFSFTAPRMLFSGSYFHDLTAGIMSYDVAPDGRFVMIQRGNDAAATPTSIVVVQNLGEELERRAQPSRR